MVLVLFVVIVVVVFVVVAVVVLVVVAFVVVVVIFKSRLAIEAEVIQLLQTQSTEFIR